MVIIMIGLIIILNYLVCKKFIGNKINPFDICNKKVLLSVLIQLFLFVILGSILAKLVLFIVYIVAITLMYISTKGNKND